MTNEMIITQARIDLMKEGKIGKTGRVLTIVDAAGNKSQIEEPEELHTFAHWKENGFSVRKGEHAVARLLIWKHAGNVEIKEDGSEIDKSRMFMKTACFFSRSQVDELKAE